MSDEENDKNSPEVDDAIELDLSDDEAEDSELQQKYDKLKSDFMYLGAEFENYKRHAIKERSESSRYGAERFARDLLDVIDNFERALATESSVENKDQFRQGVVLIHRELIQLLNKHNVQEINSQGQAFDPSTHEALTSEETDQVPPGFIARVFRKAYRLHDRLLRPAQVVVAKAPNKSAQSEE